MRDVNAWRETVLAALDAAQRLWLDVLHRLGLTHAVDGQAAWPHPQRFAAQVLAYDDSLLRQLLGSLAALGVAGLCLMWAALLLWRRWRARRSLATSVSVGTFAARDALGRAAHAGLAPHARPVLKALDRAARQPAPRRAEQPPVWRALRWPLGLGGLALWLAPWPAPQLLLQPAVPSSFHASPTGFSAQSIVRGQALYLAHCASCHGDTGRADGPRASEGDTWPPMLAGGLIGKRLEGELLWRVRHGWGEGASAAQTRHRFADALSTEATWAVLDFLAANVAGQNLAEAGEWPQAVKLPTTEWWCAQGGLPAMGLGALGATSASAGLGEGETRSTHTAAVPRLRALWLADLPAQRLRVVLGGAQGQLPELSPDPRLLTLLAQPPASQHAEHDAVDCGSQNGEFQQAMAVVLGVPREQLPGHQLLVDAQGWLRARSTPQSPGWRDDDLVCKPAQVAEAASARAIRSANPPASTTALPQGEGAGANQTDGLDALIARMDASPLSPVRAGFVHR